MSSRDHDDDRPVRRARPAPKSSGSLTWLWLLLAGGAVAAVLAVGVGYFIYEQEQNKQARAAYLRAVEVWDGVVMSNQLISRERDEKRKGLRAAGKSVEQATAEAGEDAKQSEAARTQDALKQEVSALVTRWGGRWAALGLPDPRK